MTKEQIKGLEDHGFTIINPNTKRAENIISNINGRDEGRELHLIYSRASEAKHEAMEYCKNLCRIFDGYNFHITGHNCMCFSVGFETDYGYFFITRDYNYFVEKRDDAE